MAAALGPYRTSAVVTVRWAACGMVITGLKKNWDSTSYTTDEPHCLRRTDGPKVYPGDLDGEVHDDGEIWSHALWDINRSLGRTTANRIILESQFFFNPTITMPAAAQQTVAAARALYGPRAAAKVTKAFHDRGIL